MSKAPVIRRAVVWGGLALTVAVSLWTSRQRGIGEQETSVGLPKEIDMQTTTPIAPADPKNPLTLAGSGALVRVAANEVPEGVDAFAVQSWQPAPSLPEPLPSPPPQPEPTAPALPFSYMGRQEQPGGPTPTTFYLTRGEDLFAVVAGDKLGDEYRFDGVDQGMLQFTYLPLSVKQAMNPGLNP